jgi:putative PIN family toxin of toxin-antitoxin system
MIGATLDVNVLASGFLVKTGVPAELVRSWLGRAYQPVLSDHILTGLDRTLRKPYVQRRMTPEQMLDVLTVLRNRATLVIPTTPVYGVGEDEEDDLVLSTALTGLAEFLVTGDRHLQQIGNYQGLIIIPPRDFLDVLARDVT